MDVLAYCRAMVSYCRQRTQFEGESAAFWGEEAAQWEALVREYQGHGLDSKDKAKVSTPEAPGPDDQAGLRHIWSDAEAPKECAGPRELRM
jgi:hypothetical protein